MDVPVYLVNNAALHATGTRCRNTKGHTVTVGVPAVKYLTHWLGIDSISAPGGKRVRLDRDDVRFEEEIVEAACAARTSTGWERERSRKLPVGYPLRTVAHTDT